MLSLRSWLGDGSRKEVLSTLITSVVCSCHCRSWVLVEVVIVGETNLQLVGLCLFCPVQICLLEVVELPKCNYIQIVLTSACHLSILCVSVRNGETMIGLRTNELLKVEPV